MSVVGPFVVLLSFLLSSNVAAWLADHGYISEDKHSLVMVVLFLLPVLALSLFVPPEHE